MQTTFFTMSGSSPPAARQEPDNDAPTDDEMPPELAQELGRLLAQALVADIRQHPKLAEVHASRGSMVESPPGPNRNSASRSRGRHGAEPGGNRRGASVEVGVT
jgi:hypothetical protein